MMDVGKDHGSGSMPEEPIFLSDALDIDQDHFLSRLEEAMPVSLISTFGELVDCAASDTVRKILSRTDIEPFDYLPVDQDGTYVGLLEHHLLRGQRNEGQLNDDALVEEIMQPISEDCLIAAEASLLRFVEQADAQPCRLVLRGTQIDGIVNISDLQKLPVRAALLTLITHLELLMTAVLRNSYVSDERLFEEIRSKRRRKKALDKWSELVSSDMVLDAMGALEFCDKRDLLSRVGKGKWTKKQFDPQFKDIEDLRNSLAHVGDYAITRERARQTSKTVRLIQRWIGTFRDILSEPGTHSN